MQPRPDYPSVPMNDTEPDTSTSFTQLGLSLSSSPTWETDIHLLAKHASQKLGFLARARGFFSSSHLPTKYKSQIRPSLEYCSHVWDGAPKSTLCILDKVQSKAIRLTNNPNLTKSLQSLSHRRLVGALAIFSRFFHSHCSHEVREVLQKQPVCFKCFKFPGLLTAADRFFPLCARNINKKTSVTSLTIGSRNVRTLMDNQHANRPERRTALIARELSRYNIQIATLTQSRLASEGQLTEGKAGSPFSGVVAATRNVAKQVWVLLSDQVW